MSNATTLLGIFTNTTTEGVTYRDLTNTGITLVAPSGAIVDITINNFADVGPAWTVEAYKGADRRNFITSIGCDTANAVAYADSILSAA